MARLALIRQKYNPAGGAERFVSQALDHLQQHGINLTLIARQWHPMENIDCVEVNPFYWGSLWRDWSFSRAVQKHLKTAQYTLTQSHERIPGCTLYRAGDGVHRVWLTLRKRTLSPFKKMGLALNPYHHFVCHQEAKLFSSPHLKKVICNSHMVRQEILDHFPITDDKIVVIYNGVDLSKFNLSVQSYRTAIRSQLQIPDRAPTLVYVGSGFERKGISMALKAITPFPHIHLIVVGGDKHLPHYQRQADLKRVHFVGPQLDVRPYLGASDGFILPTLYDPFPNAALEALACGLPVITTTTCGTSELLKDETGYVCDALDEDGFINAVGQWQARVGTGNFSREKIHASISHLAMEKMRDQLLTLYNQLMTS